MNKYTETSSSLNYHIYFITEKRENFFLSIRFFLFSFPHFFHGQVITTPWSLWMLGLTITILSLLLQLLENVGGKKSQSLSLVDKWSKSTNHIWILGLNLVWMGWVDEMSP